jgi:hypothetical protein
MSDRKAGDFYIVNGESIATQQPWGYYTRVCIKHYTDYGETLAGVYYHDLTREGVVTAIVETDNYPSLQVYPNPTGGELRIRNDELEIMDIQIFDIFGRTVGANLRVCPESNSINISHLPKGMYFIRIQTNKEIVIKKIIKK